MKTKATFQHLECLARHVRLAKEEHPKATVYYDWEADEIMITYPLPDDFKNMKPFKFDINRPGY